MDNQRNIILAAVLSLGVLFTWQALVVQPRIDRERAIAEQLAAQNPQSAQPVTPVAPADGATPGVPAAQPPASSGANAVPGASAAQAGQADVPRLALKSDKLEGSINLRGGRIDDLRLMEYRVTIDEDSEKIRLLAPSSNPNGYFAEFGFSPDPALGALPGPQTIWAQQGSGDLTPQNPVTLTTTNEQGLTFTRIIAVDNDYMFTVTDKVNNGTGAAVALKPYGRIARFGEPETAGIYVLHEGMIGAVGEEGLDEIDYDDVKEEGLIQRQPATVGWLGITDKYWATSLIPEGTFTAAYRYVVDQRPFYQTEYIGAPLTINAGGEATTTARFFAGAKKVSTIDAYAEQLNLPLFDKIIDWGWFYWLTKPLFQVMHWIYGIVGNFGVAILIVTVLIKIAFFPLANKSYASMANMKKVQPQLTAIREQYGDDKAAQQKAMMEIYKKEKINPAAGCWPVLIQIPVFFALYKVIYVTIDMRHAPFFGWINDLSAPDPTSIFNLFGLLPFDVPLFLMIGVWPLLMGITMFIQMQMNPAPPDPTQQMIFKWMPVLFTFMLATFPAGLVIYWAWNNFLSILQQGTIMKRQGAKIELWDNLKGMFAGKKKEAS
ncbi:membrane protein insertase YidC [Pseudahrensia aquimaris]|uniref:Membrane protein insertase YidC n=1 Tax=Pseudahrensia aquimaris TaxID=744461 RepID=A0ABW3FG74_9HYPH